MWRNGIDSITWHHHGHMIISKSLHLLEKGYSRSVSISSKKQSTQFTKKTKLGCFDWYAFLVESIQLKYLNFLKNSMGLIAGRKYFQADSIDNWINCSVPKMEAGIWKYFNVFGFYASKSLINESDYHSSLRNCIQFTQHSIKVYLIAIVAL